MKLAVLLIAFLLINDAMAATEEEARLVTKALDILSGESLIVGKYRTGFAPRKPTELAWAFSVIVKKSTNPVLAFVELAETGSYYGLIGLWVLDKARYECEIANFTGDVTVCVLIGDSFGEVNGGDFMRKDIEKDGKRIFDELLFDKLPDWQDTVKITSPCLEFKNNRLNLTSQPKHGEG